MAVKIASFFGNKTAIEVAKGHKRQHDIERTSYEAILT